MATPSLLMEAKGQDRVFLLVVMSPDHLCLLKHQDHIRHILSIQAILDILQDCQQLDCQSSTRCPNQIQVHPRHLFPMHPVEDNPLFDQDNQEDHLVRSPLNHMTLPDET
jgi:hypothetical protein